MAKKKATAKGIGSAIRASGHRPGSDFGAFYALGYLIVAFPRGVDARRVRANLLAGGYEPRDVQHIEPAAAARSLRVNVENAGLLAALGSSRDALIQQLRQAERGCHFLLVHAATREETDRVMNVVRRVPFRLAQKYHRFAIEDLD